jgi:hypothetical protein
MSPDILLTRSPDPPVRLCDLLAKKVAEGVQVYVLLYKEALPAMQKKHKSGQTRDYLRLLGCHVIRHGWFANQVRIP